jgi:hypothetical protein
LRGPWDKPSSGPGAAIHTVTKEKPANYPSAYSLVGVMAVVAVMSVMDVAGVMSVVGGCVRLGFR